MLCQFVGWSVCLSQKCKCPIFQHIIANRGRTEEGKEKEEKEGKEGKEGKEEKEEKEEKEGKEEKENLVPIVSASLSWLNLASEQIPSAPSALAMLFKFACRYSLK